MAHPPYTITDHTADLGLEFYGTDLEDLFENAGAALTACMTDPETLSFREEYFFSAEGGDREELMVNVLRELLYLANGRGFLTKRVIIDHLDEHRCSGRVLGETFDADRHAITQELKAVTYHGARVTGGDAGGLKGQVILDV
ncbi:MAG: archease [Syntrophales bacterium]|jgi:SHS2 domain-containing protein|nr:archease [Syntrophales bacterium]MCK9527180.1 archease [Syntrophales bacterium]MDX9921695.1 archease [Syntrophales bacterium]